MLEKPRRFRVKHRCVAVATVGYQIQIWRFLEKALGGCIAKKILPSLATQGWTGNPECTFIIANRLRFVKRGGLAIKGNKNEGGFDGAENGE